MLNVKIPQKKSFIEQGEAISFQKRYFLRTIVILFVLFGIAPKKANAPINSHIHSTQKYP
ncbi:hypothetical protein DDZ16_15790 [Marinilabilia rubra]|uniref:Uncharacterized protein n=1 Tax=Marinilabilia rubra TaxID=2162893 RepID=A0A2U2B5N8_9BACT|nr:hypothetical protein DDZ16_15790 [Marinilabilia rubra]